MSAVSETTPHLHTPATDPASPLKVQSFFSGSTLEYITHGITLTADPDFGEVYKIPARGNLHGGVPFELRRTGQKIKRLQLWSVVSRLRGVQVTFEDGAVKQAGVLSGESRAIDFHPDESITSTSISSAGFEAGRAGNLELKTDFGQNYLGVFPSIPPLNQFTPHIEIKQGTLIGVYGRSGSDLDSLGIVLALPEDTEYEYANITYDLSAFRVVGERLLSLKEGIIKNRSAGTVTEALLFSHAYTATKSWSNQVGLKIGVKTTVKTGVPFIVEGKVEFSAEANYSYTWGESVADQQTDSWTVTVAVPPKTSVRVLATVTESTIDVPYSADIVILRSDGSRQTIKNFSGVYRGVNVSSFFSEAKDIPQLEDGD